MGTEKKSLYNTIYGIEVSNDMLKEENKLLREHIKDLESDINRLYYTMISLKSIAQEEIEKLEDIEEI